MTNYLFSSPTRNSPISGCFIGSVFKQWKSNHSNCRSNRHWRNVVKKYSKHTLNWNSKLTNQFVARLFRVFLWEFTIPDNEIITKVSKDNLENWGNAYCSLYFSHSKLPLFSFFFETHISPAIGIKIFRTSEFWNG